MKHLGLIFVFISATLLGSEQYEMRVEGSLKTTTPLVGIGDKISIIVPAPVLSYYSKNFYRFHIYHISENESFSKIAQINRSNGYTRSYSYLKNNVLLSRIWARFLSFGSLMDSLKVFDVYDQNKKIIGSIEGTWFTSSSGIFTFYDEFYFPFAEAQIEEEGFSLLVNGEEVARFTRDLSLDSDSMIWSYNWNIEMSEQDVVDERFLWPFTAFIAEVWWR